MQALPQLFNRQAQGSGIEAIAIDIDQDELCCGRAPAQEGHLPGAQWARAVEVQRQRPLAIHVQDLVFVQVLYKLAEPKKLAMAVMKDHLAKRPLA